MSAPAPAPGLAAAKAPPFLLPGEHFAAALAFLVLGALGAVVVAPDLAAGAFPLPRVVGVTHLFTLGWITTSIMGALYQFLPVALGEPVRSVRAGHLAFLLYVPGVVAFVTGLMSGVEVLLLAGAVTLGVAVLVFIGNLAATLRRASRRDLTWWALAGAALYLGVTLALGLALAGNLHRGYLGAARMVALGTHLHVALAGWVLLVMVGVAHRLLPMFLLSHGARQDYAQAAVLLLAAGAGTLAVGHHGPPLVSRWLPAVLLVFGVGAFLLQARQFYHHRRRPQLDPGMRLAAGALATLGVGLVLGVNALAGPTSPRAWTTYLVATVLGISLFVAAHYYKIVPFLVWYHRFGPLAGKRPLPMVAELYSARAATVAGALLLSGTALLAGGVGAGTAVVARVGAMLLAAGAIVEAIQMAALSRRAP